MENEIRSRYLEIEEILMMDDDDDQYPGFDFTNHIVDLDHHQTHSHHHHHHANTTSTLLQQPYQHSVPHSFNLQDPRHGLLGLKLTKTSSFMRRLLEMKINSTPGHHLTHDIEIPAGNGDSQVQRFVGSQTFSDAKVKASNVPMIGIQIGDWEYKCQFEGDLVAKVYYARKRLVWEFLEGGLKSKMEMRWSHVTAIKVVKHPNQPENLFIELAEPPLFYRETPPQPRKHTHWEQTYDFTLGRASQYRRQRAMFLPGVLDAHYEKLIRCNPDFLIMSQRPFPSDEDSCPYFQPPTCNIIYEIELTPHYYPFINPFINDPPIFRNPFFLGPSFNVRPTPLLTMPQMREDDDASNVDDGNLSSVVYHYQGRD